MGKNMSDRESGQASKPGMACRKFQDMALLGRYYHVSRTWSEMPVEAASEMMATCRRESMVVQVHSGGDSHCLPSHPSFCLPPIRRALPQGQQEPGLQVRSLARAPSRYALPWDRKGMMARQHRTGVTHQLAPVLKCRFLLKVDIVQGAARVGSARHIPLRGTWGKILEA